MISEALEFIFGKAEEAANPRPESYKLGKRRRIVTLAGEQHEEEIEPPKLSRRAHSLDSVATLTEEFSGEVATAFVAEDGIKVILDDDDRMETVVMSFEHSEQFNELCRLANGETQRKLVKILRTKLAGCVNNDLFTAIVRQLEFDVQRGSRSDIQHGGESLGNSVEKQVRAKAGEMPEEIRVTVPLFSVPHDVPTEITLTCAVTLDLDNQRIEIEPTGDSLLREKKRILQEIIGTLDSRMPEKAAVVFGSVSVHDLVS